MPKVGYIQNGVTKSKNGRRKTTTKRRKRNPATVKVKRRNGTTKAGALSFAKKNGMRLVSKTSINPKRKRRTKRTKRNGIATVSRSRNGIFGNTKHDATQVIALLGGMGVTKVLGRIVGNFANPYIAQTGLGNYTEILAEAGVALFVIPMVTKKISPSSVTNARLGGLAAVGLSALDKFGGPSLNFLNPFNSSPVVMAGNQPLLTPNAAAQIAGAAAADASRQVTSALSGMGMGRSMRNSMSVAPLYD